MPIPASSAKSDSAAAMRETASIDSIIKNDKKKKFGIPRLFSSKRNKTRSSDDDPCNSDEEQNGMISARRRAFLEDSPIMRKSFSERQPSSGISNLNLRIREKRVMADEELEEIRIFVSTWNVGGKTPQDGLNLEDFLQIEDPCDMYVLGFQEIVPLNAGNVLVSEDNEPAGRWLVLINKALNKEEDDSRKEMKLNTLQKSSLKMLARRFKRCNCSMEQDGKVDSSSATRGTSYRLVSSKQMVGIFLSVWARRDLLDRIGHLRDSTISRGVMGYLGNKGCISLTMTLRGTSFCFVCCHLASGEKDGDEVRRNADVAEILKSTQFGKICGNASEGIVDNDRVIWFGDLNYRMALSYEETRVLMERNDWDSLLDNDQLNMEREAGRVFEGWNEGRIFFAPTYKYSQNSDAYAGETEKSRRKRRTPAWCDRILWKGNGMEQLSYTRGESRFSDHRPVCAVFSVEVKQRSDPKMEEKEE